jgi:hypothetical protein
MTYFSTIIAATINKETAASLNLSDGKKAILFSQKKNSKKK